MRGLQGDARDAVAADELRHGDRFWGQIRGSSGRFRALRERGRRTDEQLSLRGKALYKRESSARHPKRKSSMVRRGSTVRVRQRASRGIARTHGGFRLVTAQERGPLRGLDPAVVRFPSGSGYRTPSKAVASLCPVSFPSRREKAAQRAQVAELDRLTVRQRLAHELNEHRTDIPAVLNALLEKAKRGDVPAARELRRLV